MKTSLWPHQAEAVAACVTGFVTSDRGQCLMTCGSGKTLVAIRLFEALSARTLLVLIPSLTLVRQTHAVFARETEAFEALAVCYDQTVVESPGCRVATGDEDLGAFLRGPGRRVIYCTYQSAARLSDLKFDLGIFDEAHKTSGDVEKAFALGLTDDCFTIKKRLFMTATPRHTLVRESGHFEQYAMNDPKVYGSVFYMLSFREAIDRKVVCDYRLVVSVLLDSGVDVDRVAARQVALAKAMKKFDVSKVFSYHTLVAGAVEFGSGGDRTMPGVEVLHINGKQTMVTRHKTMEAFENAKKAVLTNARCLNEGVDVPSVDMVAFMDPRSSAVDITQAVGRAMRRTADHKETGYIFLPLFVPEEAFKKGFDGMSLGGRFDHLYDALQALREQDEVLSAAIARTWEFPDKAALPNVIIEAEVDDIVLEQLKRAITVRLLEVASGVGPTLGRKTELLRRARAGEPRPSFQKERKLTELFRLYVTPGSKVYDAVFHRTVQTMRPEWLETLCTGHAAALQQLITMAGRKVPKPSRKAKDPELRRLAGVLHRSISPRGSTYNAKFTAEILKKAPHWKLKWQYSNSGKKGGRPKHSA